MKTGDHILRQDIDCRATHEAIRHIVQGQGKSVLASVGEYGERPDSTILFLNSMGLLRWGDIALNGRRFTPADLGIAPSGWMTHHGGPQPVPDGTPIVVEWRNGTRWESAAGDPSAARWSHTDSPTDIIRWRFHFDEEQAKAEEAHPYTRRPGDTNHYGGPGPELLVDPTFNAVWNEIKSWGINVPEEYDGYCGATGNHAAAIVRAIRARVAVSEEEQPMTESTTPALLREIADVMEERPGDWWREFDELFLSGDWKPFQSSTTALYTATSYPHCIRRRPRTICIAGTEIPEPMREAPPVGTIYYIANTAYREPARMNKWTGGKFDLRQLKHARCHLTREAAEAHARAEILAAGGEVE